MKTMDVVVSLFILMASLVSCYNGMSPTVSQVCPADAADQMTKCTSSLTQFTNISSRTVLIAYCRALKKVPVCLERILHQCQGHSELGPIDSLKEATYMWKKKFDRICEPICERSKQTEPMTGVSASLNSAVKVVLGALVCHVLCVLLLT